MPWPSWEDITSYFSPEESTERLWNAGYRETSPEEENYQTFQRIKKLPPAEDINLDAPAITPRGISGPTRLTPPKQESTYDKLMGYIHEPLKDVREKIHSFTEDWTGREGWQPSDLMSAISFSADPADWNPAGKVGQAAKEAALLVPARFQKEMIEDVVEGIKRQAAQTISPGHTMQYAGDVGNLLEKLGPMGRHIRKIQIDKPTLGSNAYYMGPGLSSRELSKRRAAEWMEQERLGGVPRDIEDYRRLLGNLIGVKDIGPELVNREKAMGNLLHEIGHGAQDIGFTKDFYEKVPLPGSQPRYWTSPKEIGARTSEAQLPYYLALMEGKTPEEARALIRPVGERFREELTHAVNAASALQFKRRGPTWSRSSKQAEMLKELETEYIPKLLFTSEGKRKWTENPFRTVLFPSPKTFAESRLTTGDREFLARLKAGEIEAGTKWPYHTMDWGQYGGSSMVFPR